MTCETTWTNINGDIDTVWSSRSCDLEAHPSGWNTVDGGLWTDLNSNPWDSVETGG